METVTYSTLYFYFFVAVILFINVSITREDYGKYRAKKEGDPLVQFDLRELAIKLFWVNLVLTVIYGLMVFIIVQAENWLGIEATREIALTLLILLYLYDYYEEWSTGKDFFENKQNYWRLAFIVLLSLTFI